MPLLQMSAKCATAIRLGKGYIRGWRLTFQGEAGNGTENIVPCHDGIVPAAVWAITVEDEKELDARYNDPIQYTKLELPVIIEGKPLMGFTYVLNERLPVASLSCLMKKIMQEGYSDNDIDISEWDSRFF